MAPHCKRAYNSHYPPRPLSFLIAETTIPVVPRAPIELYGGVSPSRTAIPVMPSGAFRALFRVPLNIFGGSPQEREEDSGKSAMVSKNFGGGSQKFGDA